MGDVWPQLALVGVLVLINAAFAGTELALVSLRESQLQRLEQRSSTGAVLARLARQPNQFLATIQIGITLAGFLASAAAAVSLAEPLEEPLGFLGGAARPTSIIVVTLVLSYFTLVVGELAPKRLAMQRAEKWGLVMARPLDMLSRVTKPIVWILSKSTDLLVRLLGGDPNLQREDVTEDELRDMVAIQETFSDHQRRIIDGAFEVSERRVDEVMVPRLDVFVLDDALSSEEALHLLKASGHSRAPVATSRNLDSAVGVAHLRDLIDAADPALANVTNELIRFPEAARVLTALREFQIRRMQIGLVVNERGVAVGIVTVEDLVEEVVGEIYDETDPDLATVRHDPDGTIVIPGRFPVHDLRDIGVDLPAGDYATVAGLMLDRLGHFPDIGTVATIERWDLEVRAIHRHGISEVALRPVADDE